MSTSVRISQEGGTIDGTTRTWTTQPVLGFTGGIMVILGATNGEYLAQTGIWQFGVDDFRIPFKESDREDRWNQYLGPNITQQIQSSSQIEIVHAHKPRDRMQAQLNQLKGVAEGIGAIAGVIRVFTG